MKIEHTGIEVGNGAAQRVSQAYTNKYGLGFCFGLGDSGWDPENEPKIFHVNVVIRQDNNTA